MTTASDESTPLRSPGGGAALRLTGASLVPIRLRAPVLGGARLQLGDGGWRVGWELHLFAEDGAIGRGEASPLPGYGGGEPTAVHDALAPLCGPFGRASGAEVRAIVALGTTGDDSGQGAVAWLAAACASVAGDVTDWPAAARFALESAMLDLAAQASGRSMAEVLGGKDRTIVSHRLIADEAAARAARDEAVEAGAVWKLKAGAATWDEDHARIAAIAAIANQAGASLRLDANGGWEEPAAVTALGALAALGVRLCEEPLRGADPAALARLRRLGVAIAADESCRDLPRLRQLIAAHAIDALVLKPACTGLGVALAMAHEAARAGVDVLVTTMLDGAVATRAARALALAVPAARLGVCGLGLGSQALVVRSGAASMPWAWQAAPVVVAAAAAPKLPAMAGNVTAASLLTRARACARIAWEAGLRPGARVALAARADVDAVAWLHGLGLAGCEAWLVAPDARADELRLRLRPKAGPPTPGAATATETSEGDGARDGDGARCHDEAPDAGIDAYVADPGLPWPDLPHARVLPPSPAIHVACSEGATEADDRPWPMEEVRVRIWSSGSTGRPRPQALNGRQLCASATGSAFRLGHAPGDGWLCPLPWHHIGGLSVLLRTAWGHGTAVLCPADPAAIEAALADPALRVRRISLTPALLQAWLQLRAGRSAQGQALAAATPLVAVLVGGAELPAALRDQALAAGLPIARSWGMSEAASQIATTLAGAEALALGARGVEALPPVATALVQADEDGRLHVAGPVVATTGLASADLGSCETGVRVEGRADDVVISGGAKIDPAAVEAALCGHDAVAAALVFAVDDPRWGQRPRALLVPRRSDGGDDAPLPPVLALRATVAARLPAWMAPDAVAWVDALPTVGIGKPSRRAARRLWAQLGLGEGAPLRDALAGASQRDPLGGAAASIAAAPAAAAVAPPQPLEVR